MATRRIEENRMLGRPCLLLILVACSDPASTGLRMTPAPQDGFCCPIEEPTCSCFFNGGWVATNDISQCHRLCDLAPPAETHTEAHGCRVISGPNSCTTLPPDASGNAPADASLDGPADASLDGPAGALD